MTQPILITTDGSTLAERIMAVVGPLAKAQDAPLVLVRVEPEASSRAEEEDHLDAARQGLDDFTVRLKAQGYSVTSRLERGDPAERILVAVEEERPFLVAMASHGRSGVERIVRGSVAERVLRHCPAPLLLANPHGLPEGEGKGFPRILVPLDGSDVSDEILPLVAQMARAFGSKVTLLRVEPFLYTAVPSPVLQQEVWDEEQVKSTLEPRRKQLHDLGVEDVETQAAYGIEASEILNAARDGDLIAMSTHGRSGVSRWWFGSVAESVSRHAPCPLLIRRVPS